MCVSVYSLVTVLVGVLVRRICWSIRRRIVRISWCIGRSISRSISRSVSRSNCTTVGVGVLVGVLVGVCRC